MTHSHVYESGFDEDAGKSIRTTTCPECDGALRTEGGETSCRECGLIVEEQRLTLQAAPTFGDEERNRKRTGAPLTPARHDRGLSTKIGYGGDANGNALSARKRRRMHRLRREHTRAKWRSKAERNLADACNEIARITSALDLPKAVRDEASQLYRRAQTENLIRGRSIDTIAAGSVYAACRCRGSTRSITEVAAVARCSESKVTLGYGVLNAELGLETQILRSVDLIPQFASESGVPNRVQHRALELAELSETVGIANGRKPSGVAAGCLYLASQEHDREDEFTQAALARAAGVSAITLRERYYELRDAQ